MEAVGESKGYTWTTRDPVSWQANDAHLPFRDLLTLPTSSVQVHEYRREDSLSKDRRGGGGPRQFHDLAPNVRGMFVDQSLGRISKQQFRDDEKPHIFFTIEGLLEDMAPVAICSKFDDTPSDGENRQQE